MFQSSPVGDDGCNSIPQKPLRHEVILVVCAKQSFKQLKNRQEQVKELQKAQNIGFLRNREKRRFFPLYTHRA